MSFNRPYRSRGIWITWLRAKHKWKIVIKDIVHAQEKMLPLADLFMEQIGIIVSNHGRTQIGK